MNERFARIAGLLRRLLALAAGLLVFAVVLGAFLAYLTMSGTSLRALRHATAALGRLVAGQRTERLVLNVSILPAAGRLSGTATLTVRSLEEGRRRFYFLLNPGLHVRAVTVTAGETRAQPQAYQLWLLTIVDAGSPVAKDATVQLAIEYDGQPSASVFASGTGPLQADNVLLGVESFWYPTDVQGFFTADVTVTAPAHLTVVHNGIDATRVVRGTAQEIHWTADRPIGGMALAAGPYTLKTATVDGVTYRLYLQNSVDLDPERVLQLMQAAHGTLTERYGPSGFDQVTMFVSRDLRRAFNDGSGLMGVSIRYFRAGDYGFQILAHELAHNWWGATVAEQWLSPGTGGEWIVEGFAEFSSLIATESQYGEEALTRRLAAEFFDPARQAALTSMSVLDNVMAEATARDTIYRKGAYVAMMLRQVLGDETYFQGLREFLKRFRYRQVSEVDLKTVLEEVSGQDLGPFFADWVRSDRLADLALDGASPTQASVRNLGPAVVPGAIDIWRFKKAGGAPERGSVQVGEEVRLAPDDDYLLLDPLLSWADMQRENNRYPRHRDPIFIATIGAQSAITVGEAFPWVRATLSTGAGGSQNAWDFERGFLQPPSWAADGERLVVSYSDPHAPLPPIISLSTTGARVKVGSGMAPAAGPHGTTYAALGDRIVRFTSAGSEATVVRRAQTVLDLPRPSPDGSQVAYTSARGNNMELRVVSDDGANDRLLVPWDRDRTLLVWATDGSRLYALMGGNWDWQIWEVPLAFGAVRTLARDAAAIGSVALSPNGAQLAFTAAPELDYPANRRQLYVLDLGAERSHHIDIPDADLSELAWQDDDTVLVVATGTGAEHPWTLPATRHIKRVQLTDERVTDVE
jgi:hypothetical protein